MSIRSTLSAVAVGSLAASALALGAGAPASADPATTPAATDIVGVGSDTSQFVLDYLADGFTPTGGQRIAGYNDGRTSGRLASFHALIGGASATITPKQGAPAVARPNGSGQGKAALFNPSNPAIDYARSSSALSQTEVNAGLFAYPFAVDGLGLAVANSTNAPAGLTAAQIVDIYEGDVTNWSQVGGRSGQIAPMIPQSGSGTRSFFVSELTKLNNGIAVSLGANVAEVQEHDDAPVRGNANAIVPFSTGRADLAGTVKIVNGLNAKRALYNVVRSADLTRLGGLFGTGGFVCSTEARPLIEAAGFDQLARPEFGGVCGQATQGATSNFTTNDVVVTRTALAATAPAAGRVTLRATVDAAGADVSGGSVRFYEQGSEAVLGEAEFAQGAFTLQLSGVAPGRRSYVAVFTPASGALQEGSSSSLGSVVVTAASTTRVSVSPASGAYGAKRVVRAQVASAGDATPTGRVTFTVGRTTRTVALSNGAASFTLPTLNAGRASVRASYSGDTLTAASAGTVAVGVSKARASVRAAFPRAVSARGQARGTVTVAVSGVKASGVVKVTRGGRTIAQGRVAGGRAVVRLPRLPRGTHTLGVVYAGNANIAAARTSFRIASR